MYGSFRFMPPEARGDALARPRLLRSLKGRWDHRVVSLVGGPGLGKTTLLAQAIAENLIAPRGEDVWVGVGPHDGDADRLAHLVSTALRARSAHQSEGEDGGPGPVRQTSTHADVPMLEPAAVAEAVWRRSPTEACLVIDDLHLLPQESSGAAWLGDLVHALPANGHVVFASRVDPPIPLTRLAAQGATLRVSEDELRFSQEELAGFAARRGLDPGRFESTAGWPAMVELAASVDVEVTGDFLWEEVLQPLGSLGRHVLAVVCDIGGADDALASAALGTQVDLSRALADVPLLARCVEGWYRPHALWQSAPGLVLDQRERDEIRQRAAHHLASRGRYDEAMGLLQEAQLWETAPQVLRSACLESHRLVARQLGSWLSDSSEIVLSSTAGRLANGLYTAFTAPEKAVEPLEDAAAKARADGDIEAEVSALAQLGRLAWWRQDRAALDALDATVGELATTGHPKVDALRTVGAALVADFAGDDAAVLAQLDRLDPAAIDPASDDVVAWLAGIVRVESGDPAGALELVERHHGATDPAMRYILETVQLWAWWTQGRLDKSLENGPSVIAAGHRTGVGYWLYVGLTMASIGSSNVGDVNAGRICDDWSVPLAPPSAHGGLTVPNAVAKASLQVADGDEHGARDTLRAAMDAHGLDRGIDRRAWRQALSVSYVLLPETRAHWDKVATRGYLGTARAAADAVVALRNGSDAGPKLQSLDVSNVSLVRAAMHYRFAAELAVGLAGAGRGAGRELLDSLDVPGRATVQELAEAQGRLAKHARSLLAAVPAPPPIPTYLGVLGPLTLHRGGHGALAGSAEEVIDPDLRRRKVQALLAYLVGHRRTTRSAIKAAVWPDLDERSAANNLSVTLNHVLHLLEPWRETGEPAYLLRVDGQNLHLVTGDHLHVDADDFERHLKLAATAESDGSMTEALGHYLDAAKLYRDELHGDLADADWLELERTHYRTRFVSCAVRAAQLLLGRRDIDQADEMARRALAVDEWAEDAYVVLISSTLARGDRSGAHRLLDRCLVALEGLGVEPTATIRQLQRRLQSGDFD
jgi:ATP/maltotriose-dependent transcriptional regulator MalT/DNA-binding SARP family transcriptional activator